MFDLSIFTTPEAWISLVTLVFLEIVLGVDNIVFIVLTTDRLPENLQHIGRKVGLAAAMLMRILFLCFASYLIHITSKLFAVDWGFYQHIFTMRDLVLALGGIYLIHKGIQELREMMRTAGMSEESLEAAGLVEAEGKKKGKSKGKGKRKQLTLPQAIGTIMVMDVVFSIDSVITAVGLANHLIIMIIAVMLAILLMMVFIDSVSVFINEHVEMKILALVFITAIGVLLALDGLGITSGIEVLDMHMEKLMVYFAMVFSIVMEVIQMAYRKHASNNAAAESAE